MRFIRPLVVAVLFSLIPIQDYDKVRSLLEQALAELKTTSPATVSTSTALDAALISAKPGAIITLNPSLVYASALTISKSVTLQSAVLPVSRMDATTPLPSFTGGLTITADDVSIVGIEVKNPNPLTDIVTFSGARVTLDRVRILGDPIKGAKRGVAANGNGACVIRRSYIDDTFQASPGNDSQAICAWDMAPGLLIEDNFLRGGSETILIGGSDASTATRIPSDITIRGNWITARPEWMGKPIGVKTRLEFKAARRVLVEKNRVEYCWKQGQGGYLLSLTVRNQNGKRPESTIEDLDIRDNDFAHGSAAINILSLDDNQPSVPLHRVTINGNRFTDLDPKKYGAGSNRMIQISGGSSDLTITANSFAGTNLSSSIYFYGLPKAENLVVTGNTWPKTTYGIFGNGSSVGKAWAMFVRTGTLSGNLEVTP